MIVDAVVTLTPIEEKQLRIKHEQAFYTDIYPFEDFLKDKIEMAFNDYVNKFEIVIAEGKQNG